MVDTLAIVSRYARRTATPDDTFRDLGLDCIDRHCIAMDIEEAFGRELSDDTVDGWASVADVQRVVDAFAQGLGVKAA